MASEYLKWKYRDVQPDVKRELTPQERRANWWHYHKWHVAAGIVLALCLASICWSALGIGRTDPDFQVAYVGSSRLPDDTATALQDALAALATDANGDGTVAVKLNQYAGAAAEGDSDAAMVAMAASTTLMADLTACDSYFFLLEDPYSFQRNYQVLRRMDGTLPSELDPDFESCYVPWTDCPVLNGLDLGTYTESVLGEEVQGESQDLLAGLSVARRGFWTEKTSANVEACDALWQAITEGVAP